MAITIDMAGSTYVNAMTPTEITLNSIENLESILSPYIGQKNDEQTRHSIYKTVNSYVTQCTNNYEYDAGTTVLSATTPNYEVTSDSTTNGFTWKFNYPLMTGNVVINLNDNYYSNSIYKAFGVETPESAKEAKRRALRHNMLPVTKTRAESPWIQTPAEVIAMEALREVVTEEEFRKYLKYGFVLVRGKSGATYQVYRNRSHVKVWVGGRVVEEICVYLKTVEGHAIPDTDKVVAFKAMIEADEEEFKKLGNRYRMAA